MVALGIMLAYDMTLTKDIPGWTLILFGVAVFVYQTLDAIDGQQARRTGTSSPLGQLFDHGCDALSSTILGLGLVQAVKVGGGWECSVLMITIYVSFFLAQWSEYTIHLMRTNNGYVGVTEAQLL